MKSLSRASLRQRLYRAWTQGFAQRVILPRLAKKARLEEGTAQWRKWLDPSERPLSPGSRISRSPRDDQDTGASEAPSQRIWWHAASVGELESLWPVAIEMARSDQGSGKREFILTVLSESAKERVHKLARAIEERGGSVILAGYSPWEGSWGQALKALEPDVFVTAKYEAWPELWMSLAERDVQLVIVCAKARRSLKICRNVCSWLGAKLPRMVLLSVEEGDRQRLQEIFPQASVEIGGEPRWDQVRARAQAGNPRARELSAALQDFPRPWGVLGSAWLKDLELWKEHLSALPGTLFIVPHRVGEGDLQPIEKLLSGRRVAYFRSSSMNLAEPPPVRCVLVNEMGFLSELYSVADWAYIGGGFGDGVHSTIEPAMHGIPICCGPARAQHFAEIEQLQKTGQLSLVRTAHELSVWIRDRLGAAEEQRTRWKTEAEARMGASQRIASRVHALSEGDIG